MLVIHCRLASLALLAALLATLCSADDDSANFFVKASKSVPRIGRRSDFFLKTAKSVPRIGRRSDLFHKSAKSVPRIGRRTEGLDAGAWPWIDSPDAMAAPVRRADVDFYVRKDGQPVMWSDVARDVEENPDLWPWSDFDAGSMKEVESSR